MRPLNRKLLRDLARMKAQILAIAVVLAAGVATMVMAYGTLHSLEETRRAYYERYDFADVFAPLRRAPLRVAERIADIPGVQAIEARIAEDVSLAVPGFAEPASGRLISLPEDGRPKVNGIVLRSGRMPDPQQPQEVLALEPFMQAHGFALGQEIEAIIGGRLANLRIVGTALSPEFIYALGPGRIMPDDLRFSVFWMPRPALEAALDLRGAFNDLAVTLAPGASEADVIRRIDEALDRYGGFAAFGRDLQISHAFLSSEFKQLNTLGSIIPPIFLGVAAFLLSLVISRLIDTEREQIGLLKAFGYSNTDVGLHYMKLILILAGLGVILGFALGSWGGLWMTGVYGSHFRFPLLLYRPELSTFAIAAAIAFAIAIIAGLRSVLRAANLPPAVAMTPPPPPGYRRSALERIGVDRLMDGPSRMAVRHIERWPLRAGLTSLGVASAIALLVALLAALNSVSGIMDLYFTRAQKQDITIAFAKAEAPKAELEIARLPGVLRTEGFRNIAAQLEHGARSERAGIAGRPVPSRLTQLFTPEMRAVRMPEDGIVLTPVMARKLDVRPGDILNVKLLEGERREAHIRVADVVETFIGGEAFMALPALNDLAGDGPRLSGVEVTIDAEQAPELFRALQDIPAVAAANIKKVALQAFRDTLAESMNVSIGIYTVFGGLIAFGVVYNAARIALSERARELASLRVLGFTRGETVYILLGELTLLILAALPLGFVLGYWLAWFIGQRMTSDLFRVPINVSDANYGMAALIVLAAALFSFIAVGRRAMKLDLMTALKTRE